MKQVFNYTRQLHRYWVDISAGQQFWCVFVCTAFYAVVYYCIEIKIDLFQGHAGRYVIRSWFFVLIFLF